MHTEDRKNKSLHFDTVASMLAAQNVRDGEVAFTKRYSTSHTVGDGSGGEYVYHSTGRSGITADGGFFHNGAGADDYWELKDQTVANVMQFGAVGDATSSAAGTDNYAAISAAAESVRGTDKLLYIPAAKQTTVASLRYYRCLQPLDFTDIRRIKMVGQVAIPSGNGITIGSSGLAPSLATYPSEIQIRVLSPQQTGGQYGLKILGLAHCHVSGTVQGFDTSVLVSPTSPEYVAYCTFDQLRVFGGRKGWDFDGNDSFINENLFLRCVVDGSSPLAWHFSDGESNNNTFLECSCEASTRPIVFDTGTNNHFINPRTEGAGDIEFSGSAGNNLVDGLYGSAFTWGADYTNTALYANFVRSRLSASRQIWETTRDDWVAHGAGATNRNVLGLTSGTMAFSAVTLGTDTWTITDTNHAYVDIPVSQGDMLEFDLGTTATGATTALYVYGLDASHGFLSSLPDATNPYLGSSYVNASGHTGTVGTMFVQAQHLPNNRVILVRRSEVKFVRFRFAQNVAYSGLQVRQLLDRKSSPKPRLILGEHRKEKGSNLGNLSGSVAIDLDASSGDNTYGTLTGNVTSLTFSGTRVGWYTLKLIQDATGSRTVTFSNIENSPPTINSTANAETLLRVYRDEAGQFWCTSALN